MDPEDTHSALRTRYWDHVRGCADECRTKVELGHISTVEELDDYVYMRADSSEYTCETHRVVETIHYTDHLEAIDKVSPTYNDKKVLRLLRCVAYYALCADIRAQNTYRDAVLLLRLKAKN
jgi:hypothetical protein